MPLIPCKRFGDIWADYDAFFAYGPGAFAWNEIDGHRVMHLLTPSGRAKPRSEHVVLYMMRQPDNWAQPGPVNGWDGNEGRPTLHPSVLVPGSWHGFLEDGALRGA